MLHRLKREHDFDQGINGGWTVPFMLSPKIEMLGNLS